MRDLPVYVHLAIMGSVWAGCTSSGPICGEGTVEVDGACVAVRPSDYRAPLVELMDLESTAGFKGGMHLDELVYRDDDQLLFGCGWTFSVNTANDPQWMKWLTEGNRHATPSGSRRPTGCKHLALDEDDPDIAYVTNPGNVDHAPHLTVWDIEASYEDEEAVVPNKLSPVQWPALQEPDTRYQGLDVENGLVWVAIHEQGVGIYQRDDVYRRLDRVGTIEGIADAHDVQVRGDLAYVVDVTGGLVIVDVSDHLAPKIVGTAWVGGQSTDVQVVDGVAWVAAGSAGLVAVDVTDPTKPAVLSTTPVRGTVVRVHVADGRAYVAAWNDVRVFDVADPSAPRFVGATRVTENADYPDDLGLRPDVTVRTFAVTSHEDVVFVGNWNNPYSYQLHPEHEAPYIYLSEEVNYLGFGRVAVGASSTRTLTVYNDGTAPLVAFHIDTDHPAFQVAPSSLRIPPGGSADLTLTYTPVSGEEEAGFLEIWSDDPQQPVRTGYLVGNSPALGIGDPFPHLVVDVLNTGEQWTYEPGQPTLLAYFATF